MALSTSTAWDQHVIRPNNVLSMGVLLAFKDGASTNYAMLTDHPGVETGVDDIQAQPVLLDISEIRQTIDPFTKRQTLAEAIVTCSNAPILQSDVAPYGVTRRLSDYFASLGSPRFQDATIYFSIGRFNTSVATGTSLARLRGVLLENYTYDDYTLVFRITNAAKTYDTLLPTTIVSDFDSDADQDYANRAIPIVYGKYTHTGGDATSQDFSGEGLAVTEYINSNKVIVSDHELNALTEQWIDFGADDPALDSGSPTLNTNDSGHGTAEVGRLDYFFQWVYAIAPEPSGVNSPYRSLGWVPADPDPMYSRGTGDDADLYDIEYDNGSTHGANPVFILGQDSFIENVISNGQARAVRVQFYIKRNGITTVSDSDFYLHYGFNVNEDAPGPTGLFSSGWSTATADMTPNLSLKTDAFAISWYVTLTDADGTRGNQDTGLDIAGCRLRLSMRRVGFEDVFVECEGRTYGSWIDSRGSNYSSGTVIEDPAGIVESILRDELGLTTADIDTDSYDAAENGNVEHHVNIHDGNKDNAFNIIQKICEQSTFLHRWDSQGKSSLVDLRENNEPTAIIDPDWVRAAPTVSTHNWLITKIIANYKWQAEYDTYRERTEWTHPWGNNAFGEWVYRANWDFLAGLSAYFIASHLVSRFHSFWGHDNIVIQFETEGFRYAHVEVGDYIVFDESMDDWVLLNNESWALRHFMVTEVGQVGASHTRFTAIELYRYKIRPLRAASAVAGGADPTVVIA